MLAWLAAEALGKSWCAAPLVAHEWGVEVLRADGVEAVGVPLPSWFHRDGAAPTGESPVRELPVDTGVRTLPVVQLYSPRTWPELPFALEVGFAAGEAAVWYPAVERRVAGTVARSPEAVAGRTALVDARAALEPYRPHPTLPPDPTRQLAWDALTLRPDPTGAPRPTELPWVEALREMPGALWVGHGDETERFVFYEATTTETSAVALARGETWTPDRPHYVLRNRSDWTVHDVVVIAHGRAFSAPAVPAGATAGFLLEDPLDRDALLAALRARWTDPDEPSPPTDWSWTSEDCVMGRDPAVPVEEAEGHRLYEAEVDLLLSVWADRLLASDGVRIVYREDVAALDAAMPVSLYTSMQAYLRWRRLGVVLVEGVTLP